MAFASLFSGPPSEGLHLADCASNQRDKAADDKAVIGHDGGGATKKKRKKKKKKGNRNGQGNKSTWNVQQEEPEDESKQRDHRPTDQRKNEWFWDYSPGLSEDKNPQSVNSRKRKQKYDDHSNRKRKRDFASELDRYRRIREAPPPADPPRPLPPPTGGLSQKIGKKINIRSQENPGKTWSHKRNQETPGPGSRGSCQRGRDQRGRGKGRDRGRGGMSRGGGLQNNKPDGRDYGNGHGPKRGKGPAQPKEEKKVFLSEDYVNRHTVEAQGRRICKYFLKGVCQRADKCNFEHDMNVKKMEMCKFYVQGCCTNQTCIYMHNDFPCMRFHSGAGAKCYYGSACRFSHEPLTDLTRELLRRYLNPDPVVKDVPQSMEQDSPMPNETRLTVDMADNVISVRPNFYNSSPLAECKLHGTSTFTQSRDIQTIPVGSPALERRSQIHAHSPAAPDCKMERDPETVHDELTSSPKEGGPKAVSSVLQTLFLNLCPTDEEPLNSGTETGFSATPHGSDVHGQSATLTVEQKQTKVTGPTDPETNVRDWLVDDEQRSGQDTADMHERWPTPLYQLLPDQEGEEEGRLRDEPALVPLEAIPGIAQRDPRSAPRAAAVTLPLPAFALKVEWDTEEQMPTPLQVVSPPPNISPAPHCYRPLVDIPKQSSCSWTPPTNTPRVASPAIHKLPVPPLARLVHPTYTRGRGVKPEVGEPAARGKQAEGHVLKGLFKNFLPASDL